MISIKGVRKHFDRVKAIDGIDLEIAGGPPTGLVGPNGAGKTTLFSLICGFLRPTAGTISIFDRPPLHKTLHGRIAILPQDAALAHAVPILRQLTFFAQLHGMSRGDAEEEAERVLELVNLSDAAEMAPEALSHGMKKRAAIAQAFIGTPDLILLDEPTAGLDPNTAAPIRELIRSTGDERKFVISSHNLADIEDLCEDVIILKKGKVTEHQQISSLVSRTSSLSFSLEKAAPAGTADKLSGVEGVTHAEVIGEDRRRLRVRFEAKSETEAQVHILNALQSAGITFKEMSRGESLEQRVREITR